MGQISTSLLAFRHQSYHNRQHWQLLCRSILNICQTTTSGLCLVSSLIAQSRCVPGLIPHSILTDSSLQSYSLSSLHSTSYILYVFYTTFNVPLCLCISFMFVCFLFLKIFLSRASMHIIKIYLILPTREVLYCEHIRKLKD